MTDYLSVTRLASRVCTSGDLHSESNEKPVDAIEGIKIQQLIQKRMEAQEPRYSAEQTVQREVSICGDLQMLRGRIDGFVNLSPTSRRIEEYKTTRSAPDSRGGADWGQVFIYGAMKPSPESIQSTELELVYIHPDTLQETRFSSVYTPAQLDLGFALILLLYEVREERHRERINYRDQLTENLDFPFAEFRPAQRNMAARNYKALVAGEHLLLEAPTGSGKSIGALYPAVKALREDEKIFFLTARNSGAEAVIQASSLLQAKNSALTCVELTARRKACFCERAGEEKTFCSFSRGYYDRSMSATNELLALGSAVKSAIEKVAEKHSVCPFELSLDTATWADIVVGDLNYVFDPYVALKRFQDRERFILLVDEAHQLADRVKEMLSVSLVLETNTLLALTSPEVGASIANIEMKIVDLANRYLFEVGEIEIERDVALEGALRSSLELFDEEKILENGEPALAEFYFMIWRWLKSFEFEETNKSILLMKAGTDGIELHHIFIDVADYISNIVSEFKASIRFSGTLSPLPVYQRLHGLEDSAMAIAESPFEASQIRVVLINDVPTYYVRREETLTDLVFIVTACLDARSGRYLIAFPSYEYLQMFVERAEVLGDSFFYQKQNNDSVEYRLLREKFERASSCVLGIVLGGSFSESIDFGSAKLSGVIVISMALPPSDLERDLTKRHFDEEKGSPWGNLIAYERPALNRVIQAVGRLVRSQSDRGVVCLVDPRFEQAQVKSLMPSIWEPVSVSKQDLRGTLDDFWSEEHS